MKYFLAYKSKSQMHMIREQIVKHALEHGTVATADEFECHRNTVSKWKSRYINQGKDGLKNIPTIPHNIPHKITNKHIIEDILKKRDAKGYSANRLKRQYGLLPSNCAINRILKENKRIDGKYKKKQKRNDLWHIKKLFRTFEKCQVDGKNLMDIPNYYVHQKMFGLPKWQFTFRDIKSGATIISYMDSEEGMSACTFIVYIFEHLSNYGIRPKKIILQTDGASFAMNLKSLKKTAFQETVEDVYGAKLVLKPGGGTKQSDVETFHRLIEDEFYRRTTFSSVADFYSKAYEYMHDFNYVRLNSHKDWKAPVSFLKEDLPNISTNILDLPPINLDNHTDLYWSKIKPTHVTSDELILLDTNPDTLRNMGIRDFSHNEYLDSFINRVYNTSNSLIGSAHDLPIQPIY